MASFQVPIYKYSNGKKLTRSMVIKGYAGRKAFRLISMGYEFQLVAKTPGVLRFSIFDTNAEITVANATHMVTNPISQDITVVFAKMVNDFWAKEF